MEAGVACAGLELDAGADAPLDHGCHDCGTAEATDADASKLRKAATLDGIAVTKAVATPSMMLRHLIGTGHAHDISTFVLHGHQHHRPSAGAISTRLY